MNYKYMLDRIVTGSLIVTCLISFSYKSRNDSIDQARQRAIDAIKEYGGFVIYDNNGEVRRISLVYYEDVSGNRQECKGSSDDILKYLPSLPETKELLIHGSQATDSAMVYVGKLTNLKLLIMWNAHVTDEGVAHLMNLNNLTKINIENAKLSDNSLLHLSKLKQLEEMTLQGNSFTDEGLSYLSEMINLKGLSIGLGNGKITDVGVQYLQNLTLLEKLDLQKTKITDVGIQYLKNFTSLKELFLSYTKITDIAIETFMNLRNLQKLSLSGTNISIESIQRLQTINPTLTIYHEEYNNMQQNKRGELDSSFWELSFKDIKGRKINMKDNKNKYILLNFWGEWYYPCLQEIPDIIKVKKELPNEKFIIISIANARNFNILKKTISEKEMDWIHIILPEYLRKEYNIIGYPTNILISNDGKTYIRRLGALDYDFLISNMNQN